MDILPNKLRVQVWAMFQHILDLRMKSLLKIVPGRMGIRERCNKRI